MNKTITLILALLFAFTAGAQNANNEDLDAKYASSLLQPGTEVPDILVDSTANLRLSDMRGHYVLPTSGHHGVPTAARTCPRWKPSTRNTTSLISLTS